MIRNFEVIGEASNNIEKHYPEFVVEHPELPLASAYQMRNAVAHGYFKVDFEIVVTRGTHPYEEIITIANDKHCDVIWIASHGRRGLDKLLLGSETQRVLAHSILPVMVYR